MNPNEGDIQKGLKPILKKISFMVGASLLAPFIINRTLKWIGSEERVGNAFYGIVKEAK